jgi:O-antigen/teichoic acid export membrane protein
VSIEENEVITVALEPPGMELAKSGLKSVQLDGWLQRLWSSDLCQKVGETYATQVVNIVLSLTTTVLVARSLGPQGRGIYAVALAIGTLGVQLSNGGLHLSNTYHVARDRTLLSALFGNALLVSFGLGGVIAFLGWGLFTVEPRFAPVQGAPLAFGLLWIPFGLALMLTENLLLGIHEVRAYNTVELLSKITGLTLAVAILLSVRPRVELFLAASLTALLLSLGTALFKVRGFVQGWPWPSLALLRDNLPLGLRAYLVMLFSFLVLRIDLLMVKYLLGAEQAGYYSVAANIADVCLMLPMTVTAVLFPKLCRMVDLRQRLALTRQAGFGIALALGLILIVAGVLAAPLVIVAFGRPFLPAASAFIWLTPGVLTLGIEIVVVQFLNSLGIPKSVIGVWVASTLANILGNLWAIPRFGIVGASAVSSISYSLTFVLILLLIVRTKYRLASEA